MRYRRLGSSGLQVSELSLGSWLTFGGQVADDTAVDCMQAAREAGVNFFDNAEGYEAGESERVMGRALKRLGWKRSDIVVSTKIFWGGSGPNEEGLSRKHLLEGTAASLARLELDYVDLLYCHRPDPNTPIEETVRAMSHLVDTGKTLYWGTSEWSAEEIRAAHSVARQEHLVPPTMEQPEYNMFNRSRVEVEYEPLYDEVGLGTTIFSPLARGLLTGKYATGIPKGSFAEKPGFDWLKARITPEAVAKVEALTPIAAELECSRAQLALAWCLRVPYVSSVITGASTAQQVKENMAASDVVPKLTPDILERIEAILADTAS
jgi:voltage-dependent potassium channel beta subunit